MTTKEFSDSFDTLLNSYNQQSLLGEGASKVDIVLDEYEKSLFLTKAQEEIVTNFYNGRNYLLESFEKTEELRRYLSSLIKTENILPEEEPTEVLLSNKSKVFTLPEDVWFITYEAVKLSESSDKCLSGKELEVTPVTQDEYHRLKENPFRRDSSTRALRLDLSDNKVEIISSYLIDKYLLRYIKRISPIILVDLSDDLSINGETNASDCELNPAIHRIILDRAVELAIISKVPNAKLT